MGIFSVLQIIKGGGKNNSIDNNNNKTEKCTYALDADSYQENIAAKLSFP